MSVRDGKDRRQRIVIVGGGLAGLSAAWELSGQESLDVTLIEKNMHLGGRVFTLNVHGQDIDVGGFLIYPWYKRYRELISVLGLKDQLAEMPAVHVYHSIKGDAKADYELSFREILELFIKTLPEALIDLDPTEPRLHDYDDLTVEAYLMSLGLAPEKVAEYLDIFDTFLQGYCYGAITEHKMAFMASTLFRNTLQGDVHGTSYLHRGSKVFIDRIGVALQSRGVDIEYGCEYLGMNEEQLVTNRGEISADHIVFCQPPIDVSYTYFITAIVTFDGEAIIGKDLDWGACFYKYDPVETFPILSVVNLEKLYGEKAAKHLILNIKVTSDVTVGDSMSAIVTQLRQQFPDIGQLDLVDSVEWRQAMPVVEEDYVDAIRHRQGLQEFYYAGDFMGCPSMETALMSGKRAAEQLLAGLHHRRKLF